MKALNVYQITLIQTLKFMHKTKYAINKFPFLDFESISPISDNIFPKQFLL